MRWTRATGSLALLFCLVITGCAGGQALNNIGNLVKLSNDGFVHKVRWQGETLSIIAKWYTGKAGNWKKLANTNAKFDPVRLQKGYKILIPRPLLKTTADMPEDFVRRYARRPAVSTAEEESVSLFGPRE
jgi:hypothetical protein